MECSVHSPSPSIISFLHCCFGIYCRIIPIALPLTCRENANGQNCTYRGFFLFCLTPLSHKRKALLQASTVRARAMFSKVVSFFVSSLLKNVWHTPSAAVAFITCPQTLCCEEHQCESTEFSWCGEGRTQDHPHLLPTPAWVPGECSSGKHCCSMTVGPAVKLLCSHKLWPCR